MTVRHMTYDCSRMTVNSLLSTDKTCDCIHMTLKALLSTGTTSILSHNIFLYNLRFFGNYLYSRNIGKNWSCLNIISELQFSSYDPFS